nr:MAG TPA_asm: hypothetical protein [Caudoviricetes sp.]
MLLPKFLYSLASLLCVQSPTTIQAYHYNL